MRKILLVLIVVAACGDDQDDAQVELTRCERLREHLIDVRLATATNVDHAAHREVMQAALGSDFLASCEKLDDDVVDCALAAPDSSSAAACAGKTSVN
jgi:hypothetical protein